MAAFPPVNITSIKSVIPAYLYEEYNDDDALQAIFDAYNQMTQAYLDWFNTTPLAVYTSDNISGLLLDWIAQGIYGTVRPALPNGGNKDLGMYNTLAFNTGTYNEFEIIGPQVLYQTTDDVFKRILTWNFYKGDGFGFSVPWLKRRVMRFLLGADGTAPGIDNAYQISVTFGANNSVTIRILNGIRTVIGGALFNSNLFNTFGYDELATSFQRLAPLSEAAVFKAAVDGGILNLPFQYTYTVVVD